MILIGLCFTLVNSETNYENCVFVVFLCRFVIVIYLLIDEYNDKFLISVFRKVVLTTNLD